VYLDSNGCSSLASMAAILNLSQEWEHYPCNLSHSFCVTEGKSQRQVLQHDASRLFSGRDDVEVWKYDYIDDGTMKPLIPPKA